MKKVAWGLLSLIAVGVPMLSANETEARTNTADPDKAVQAVHIAKQDDDVVIDLASLGIKGPKKGMLYCANLAGGRRSVWINTDKASYALNGHSIEFVQQNRKSSRPVMGADGKPWRLGRDEFPLNAVHELIRRGLELCR